MLTCCQPQLLVVLVTSKLLLVVVVIRGRHGFRSGRQSHLQTRVRSVLDGVVASGSGGGQRSGTARTLEQRQRQTGSSSCSSSSIGLSRSRRDGRRVGRRRTGNWRRRSHVAAGWRQGCETDMRLFGGGRRSVRRRTRQLSLPETACFGDIARLSFPVDYFFCRVIEMYRIKPEKKVCNCINLQIHHGTQK